MKPTDKQKKELWELVGLQTKHTFKPIGFDNMTECSNCGALKGGLWEACLTPPIDLNNLFEHAVPKLEECHLITFRQNEYYSIAKLNGKVEDATDNDPAIALFWALYKALGGDN